MKILSALRIINAIILCFSVILFNACDKKTTTRSVQVIISNTTDQDAVNVVMGVSLQAAADSLEVSDSEPIIVLDDRGSQVATQVFDNGQQKLLLFECSVIANGECAYKLQTGTPLIGEVLSVANEIDRTKNIRMQIDSIRNDKNNKSEESKAHLTDSLVHLLDATLLGGRVSLPSTARAPWNYSQLNTISEGTLMCAYQLKYDTLYVAGDTLVENRTLVMQRGSCITIVRDLFENAGRHDTLIQSKSLNIGLPVAKGDSLVLKDSLSYLAIQHNDSVSTGICVPNQQQFLRLADNHLAAFQLSFLPDSILTYYVVSDKANGTSPLTLQRVESELQQLHNPGMTARIIVQK